MEDILNAVRSGADPREAVEKTLSLPREDQERLIEETGRIRSENAGRFLTALYLSVADKKLQKSIKKALFRLKTLGIRVEEPRIEGESVLRKAETVRQAMAFMSNYDAEQTKVVVSAFEIKKNQYAFSHAIIHFSDGLMELRSFPVPRKELEGLLADYLSRLRPPVVLPPVSAPYAGYLVEEASGISRTESEEARSLNHYLSEAEGDVRRPQDIYSLEVDAAVDAEPMDRILTDEIFEPFALEWPGIEEDRKELDQAVNPGLVLPPHVMQERRGAFVRELIENKRLAPIMPSFKRMLEDYAYLFYCLKDFGSYKGLVERLKDPEAMRRGFMYFAAKALEKLEKKEDQLQQEQRQSSLIIDPYSPKR
jgi:hypothetical protein